MRSRHGLFVGLFSLLLLAVIPALGQEVSAGITGRITDPTGQPSWALP